MSMKLGIHIGPQDLSMEELRRLWQRADAAGFYWVSTWDHFYANPLENRNNPCFEGVSSMAALAALTKTVRVGCLMFCSLFRNPALLAKAAVTIDHISGGRVELGMGGGWLEEEFREFGYGFPPIRERLDMLEEGLHIVRSLLRDTSTTFKGQYYSLEGAVCAPKPVNPKLRLWVGGRGEKRTPALAAKYGDGFNVPYLSPEGYRERLSTLDRACENLGRDPAEIMRTINLGFYMGADEKGAARNAKSLEKFDAVRRSGMLTGTAQQVMDRIGEYQRAGAQGLNIAIRAPVDWDALEAYIAQVLPAFKG
ncbi:MAG: TIGR03560 family F420-dependent LLM class oxidoreductase [Deltaproteobacteria bacterium]|nr:TIGR03560 family F420-dependent LLM class oxidoreductase [Deltaproteobacteria bacterium]